MLGLFWEENHRGKVPLSHYVEVWTVDVGLDHLTEVVVVRRLHCEVPLLPPAAYHSLWEEVCMWDPHLSKTFLKIFPEWIRCLFWMKQINVQSRGIKAQVHKTYQKLIQVFTCDMIFLSLAGWLTVAM